MAETGYLHGYSSQEQNRLYQQARFLEQIVYTGVDYSGCRNLLEVGCGVGAQTEILLERFPELHITGIDASPVQLKTAREVLREPLSAGKVELFEADGAKQPFESNTFDSSFICWILEHVPKPVEILKEVHRVLRPGGVLYCTEVMNASLYLNPYSPATLQYWFAFNDHQWTLGGDPFVGAKLGNLLKDAGFQQIRVTPKPILYDKRCPENVRSQMLDYWKELLLSGTPELLRAGKVTEVLVSAMRTELDALKKDPDAVFFYSPVQSLAIKK